MGGGATGEISKDRRKLWAPMFYVEFGVGFMYVAHHLVESISIKPCCMGPEMEDSGLEKGKVAKQHQQQTKTKKAKPKKC